MQDRYAGDQGDYLKFGLLRWLAPPGSSGSPQLGVVWYRTADEAHNAGAGWRPVLALVLAEQAGHLSFQPLAALSPPR